MSHHKLKNISNQWVVSYLSAVSKSWKNEDFKTLLLEDSKKALAELGFDIPENIHIKFLEVADDDFNEFPEINLSVFDSVHSTAIHIIVPIPTKPSDMFDTLEELLEKANRPALRCTCICI